MKRSVRSRSFEELLTQRVERLRQILPRAMKADDVEAVHRARVATRRLKAALDLAEPLLSTGPRRRFARALRRLRRMLGPVRDLDVMLSHLADAERKRRDDEAIQWLTARLRGARTRLVRKCCQDSGTAFKAGSKAWPALTRELRQGEADVRKRVQREVMAQLKVFGGRADRVSASIGTNSKDAGPDLHELRISGKSLRYKLELADALGHRIRPSVLRAFKKLQDALGLWHDCVVLGERALRLAMDDLLPSRHPRLYGQVLRLSWIIWKRSERELDRFRMLWHQQAPEFKRQVFASLPQKPRERVMTASTAGEA